MKNLSYGKPYPLRKVIEEIALIVKEGEFSDWNYDLYSDSEPEILDAELQCYLEEGPSISDDDEEQYPDFVTRNNLNWIYSGQQLEDVIMNAYSQNPKATTLQIIEGLNYYSKFDTFKEI